MITIYETHFENAVKFNSPMDKLITFPELVTYILIVNDSSIPLLLLYFLLYYMIILWFYFQVKEGTLLNEVGESMSGIASKVTVIYNPLFLFKKTNWW